MAPARKVHLRVGRPRQIAGVDARENLLDAAVTLFSEQGVAGTTVAEIASKALLTPAMVHYYFTNRDQLLDAIAKERMLRTVIEIWSPVLECTEVEPMLRGVVRRVFTAVETKPWLPSLWIREVAGEGGQLSARLMSKMRTDYLDHMIKVVTAAQRRGVVDASLDPRLVLPSVLGLTMMPLAIMPLLRRMRPVNGVTRADIARHAEALLVGAFVKASSMRPQRKGRRD
jgi:AcrR family transcriptional regulator